MIPTLGHEDILQDRMSLLRMLLLFQVQTGSPKNFRVYSEPTGKELVQCNFWHIFTSSRLLNNQNQYS